MKNLTVITSKTLKEITLLVFGICFVLMTQIFSIKNNKVASQQIDVEEIASFMMFKEVRDSFEYINIYGFEFTKKIKGKLAAINQEETPATINGVL